MRRILRRLAILLGLLLAALVAYSVMVIVQARRATPAILDELMNSGRLVLRPERLPAGWIDHLLTVEDPAFYTHSGIDFSTPGAGLTTIPQGLVKMLYFERFRPGFAKLKQSLIAVFALNALVSKETHLLLFINTVYLGENGGKSVNGFTQGAQEYFGKCFEELSEDEFLSLVAMIIAPNAFHSKSNPTANAERVDRIRRLIQGRYRPKGLMDVYYDRPTSEEQNNLTVISPTP